jgi:pyridoxal phosphate enzyme (YggS family)
METEQDRLSQRIADNLSRVRMRIKEAAESAGRRVGDVELVAVTKTRSPAEIVAAYEAGVRHFGENRIEEAEGKLPLLDLEGVTWHMIGHVQSRKARRVVEVVDRIDSVDSVRLARRIDSFAADKGIVMPVLIEVNVSGEASKYGFPSSDRGALEAAICEISALPNLQVDGLMTVAFIAEDPERVRPVFAGLCELRDALRAQFPQCGWQHLSMGMSDDYEVAVQEGATMVRIGRAVFT